MLREAHEDGSGKAERFVGWSQRFVGWSQRLVGGSQRFVGMGHGSCEGSGG
ncbi:uncharacterized protein CMC5_048600 [Chondromyces crocatus]|uniref:Uncharacterized protein n=1 Tax=Chondromyces crocatus TaxID=52 RepID=A0A0K1EIM4_CHOCO|nr:uncharacterized protein CMC5_048600 [Chondromyces crocatus]